jgi:hypothetical protein
MPTNPCNSCTILGLSLTTGGPPNIFNPGARGSVGFIELQWDTPALTIQATPSIAECPCTWQLVVEYIEIITGGAAVLKRPFSFQFPQLLQTVQLPIGPPYSTVAGCRLTLDVQTLNNDLLAGFNVASVFAKGILNRIGVRVSCGGDWVTLYIQIIDPPPPPPPPPSGVPRKKPHRR